MRKESRIVVLTSLLLVAASFAAMTPVFSQEAVDVGGMEESWSEQMFYEQTSYFPPDGYIPQETVLREYPVMTILPPRPPGDIGDPNPEPTESFDDLPSQFSWTNYNGDWTTPAKDQDGCGSCWDFSALGAMEAAINIASGYPDTDIDLSEQYVLSCLSYAGSCNGGWMHLAFEAIQSTQPGPQGNGVNGVPIESCMPYQAVDYIPCEDKCDNWDYYTTPPQPDNILWQLEDWGYTEAFNPGSPTDRDIIKSWIMDRGPLSIAMYASSGFSSYWSTHHDSNDVYEGTESGWSNHGVVLVGWVDDPDVLNGGYWIIKNSWGTDWGYSGFCNVAYGCLNIGSYVAWCKTPEWPSKEQGPGPGPRNMHVFANYLYSPRYPHVGEPIKFTDTSDGKVVLTEWDFDGDGVFDATGKQVNHVFTSEGVYNVTVRVWSTWGLNSTRTRKVEVKEMWPPEAIINPEYYSGKDTTVHFEGRNSYDVDGGIVRYEWDFDGDGAVDAETPSMGFEYPALDAEYTVTLTVTDTQGLKDTATGTVRIDITTPPKTTAIVGGIGGSEIWFNEKVRVVFSAEDWTGVKEIHYRVDNGPNETVYCYGEREYQHEIFVTGEGVHTIRFYSIDVYDNVESVKTVEVKIDVTPPTLDATFSGDKNSGWFVSPVKVTLSGADELSGLNKIIYKVDEGAWKEYTGVFTIAEDGVHKVWAFAVDNAGNIYGFDEPQVVQIDTAPPTTTYRLEGEGSKNVYYRSVTVYLVGSDTGSGVKLTRYQVDGGLWMDYTQPFSVDEVGTHTIGFYSVDNLDNQEDARSVTFAVSPVNFDLEVTKPTPGIYINDVKMITLGKTIVAIGSITLQAEVVPFTAGEADVAYVEFVVDENHRFNDTVEPFEYEITDVRLIGSSEVTVTAYDSEGNSVSQTQKVFFLIF
ncbi:MAG: OmpL47-type beta-barrel domain-containing protein [Methermicoccaceae archaeon]